MVSSFLAPGKDVQYTYPDEIKTELDKAADGDYIIDVKDFRTDNKDWLLEQIYLMTERRFKAFRHLYKKEDYDFGMLVEMGLDRIHHGFWRFFDKTHRLYEPGNPYESAIYDYYRALDEEVGRAIDIADKNTSIMVVSDHGAKPMQGAICINEWLQKEGLLVLKEKPAKPMRMTMDMIDWEKTLVWGEGGYYCRIFFNVKGREPRGVIAQEEYDRFRDELKAKLEALEDEEGRCINTKVFKAEELYRQVKNIPPDLIVYLGNLDWRSAGSVGIGSVHLFENDTGPDDANHAQEGIVIWYLPGEEIKEQKEVYSIYDIAPSILRYFDIEVPEDMIGSSIL